jgi:hypothetical protein
MNLRFKSSKAFNSLLSNKVGMKVENDTVMRLEAKVTGVGNS